MTLFQLERVDFDVADRRLISTLSLDIGPGVTALIGRNGSGKSTLLKMLAAQAAPTGGTVRYRGRDLRHWTGRSLARDLAFLPQVTPPTEGMRLEELVALGRYPWRGALGRLGRTDRSAIDEAIALCGLDPLRRRIVDTLSGGERQRAWIAMMLAQGAQTLLLDEPISALDVAHQVEVLGLVQRMSRARRLSAIVVLHDVNMAARFCDHVIALGDGQVLLDGPIADLLDPDTLNRIYGLPMQVIPATPIPVVHPF
ncbi:ATP-binding cassette domain-containing protein [Pseudooceanicola sediminis]|uniref:ATP-binding cassette domain-containing protein n=1 Tax=Pseudooceanicola sediminis TaxID=2211117 RepID=A0A399IYG3_9RHOB|nr:ATP-binding cassette domain-containing protein [Pseudooceanicola sediminis]KAA2311410.1 ATP-binding cassette domain-containing protein [Puniceibacterium sp. HSS470]RII38030.1 ATP-binding cassette domain-containing protein [Pseudooceanicola sediminis]|tara:strand:+ start:6047 stop:6811 length:765 start_codon:yes stop_codon:yes gene_type:complete